MSVAKGGNKGSFKKGNPGGGRKPLPADILLARSMATEEMLRTVIEVRQMTPIEIKACDMEKISLGKRAIINAYAKLEYRGIKDYEDRLFGKAQESVNLTSDGSLPVTVNIIGK